MSFNISKRGNNGERKRDEDYTPSTVTTAPAASPASTQTESRGFHITKAETPAPAYNVGRDTRDILYQNALSTDRQEESANRAQAAHEQYKAHQAALATERADEADKLNIESPYRQATHQTLPQRVEDVLRSILYDAASAQAENIGTMAAIEGKRTAAVKDKLGYVPHSQKGLDEGRVYATPEEIQEDAHHFFDTSDRYSNTATEAQMSARAGLGKVGNAAVDVGTLLGNVGAQIGADAIIPGLGIVGRVLDVAGHTARDYRDSVGEEYDPYKAGAASALSGAGVAAGGALSRAIGNYGMDVLRNAGKITNLGAQAGVGALSGLGFAAGEIPFSEIGRHIANPEYTTDAKDVLKRAGSAAAFGSISQFLNGLRIRAQNRYTVTEPQRKMKWFSEDMTPEDAAKLRRSLARDYHPDLGGDPAIMQEINDEYSYFCEHFANKARSAYNAAATAAAKGDTAAYEAASKEYRETVAYLQEAVQDGMITGEAADAVSVLSAIATDGIAPAETVEPPSPAVPSTAAAAVTNPTYAPPTEATPHTAPAPVPAPVPEKVPEPTPVESAPVPALESEKPLQNGAEQGKMKTGKAGELQAALDASSRVNKDGIEYTITQIADSNGQPVFIAEMRNARNDALGGMIRDGFASKYRESFRTREEAASALVSVAESRGFLKEDTTSASAPDIKKPEAWDNIVDSGRVGSMSKGERAAVKNIFEQPAEKQTSVGVTAEKPAESKPLESKPAEIGDKASNPQQQIADDVRRSIEKGIAFNSARLFEIADKAFGGTQAAGAYTVKDAYDGMELAVNQHLMKSHEIAEKANGDAQAAQNTLKTLQDLLSKLPTQTKRSAEMESYQQFSTPPTIAYLAAWSANITPSDVVLEPSAGIGGLALWPKAWGATVYGNELSKRRLAFLNQLGLDGTFNLNAEQINNLLPDNIKPTTVLMNPPFSSTAGRTTTNKTANAKRHIEQALERLEDGGRLVAILGNGMSDDARAFRSWWDELRKDYSIRANLRIDGENYKKYGTTFDVQLVVIDKDGPQMGRTITGEYKDLMEIPNVLEGIRNDRTRVEAAPQAEQHAAVPSVQEPSDRSVGNGTVSRAGAERGAEGERAGLVEQESARGGRTEDVAKRADDVGRGAGKPAGSGVQNAHDERGVGRGRNERQNPPAENGGRGEQKREAAVPARGRAGEHGEQRLQLERDVSSDQLTKGAAAEAAAHPDSVYSAYVPRKARVKGAHPHPAKLVESAAMAAVEPPDVTYTPHLPQNVVEKGLLSDAQLENVIYAGQAHEQKLQNGTRKGFFIGDGTGVGKGRQIAGIIMDNFMQGRSKALWISEKAALINDAVRDWTALGGKEDDVLDLKKFKIKAGDKIKADSGIVFSSYDTLKTDKDARLKLLTDWLGKDFDGVIALDEAHNMRSAMPLKNGRGRTKPSAKALAGIELQEAFPNARVVYASATGATEASNYAYLQRLGLWGKGTAFNDFNDFMQKISNGGLAAMELVARDMKAMGEYMARSISYDDVKYDTLQHDLTPMQTEIYNTMSVAWQKVLQNVNEALEITGQQNDGMARGRAMSQIFGTQQRFYNQILTSMSMPTVIADMKKELAAGRSCVLQLVNTNAAAAERAIAKNTDEGGDLDDLDLTPSDMLIEMVQKSFPVELYEEYDDEEGRRRSRPVLDDEGKPVIDKKAVKMREALISDLKMMKVPDGPLEMLFDAFGEENVAEVTGRTRRVVEKMDANGDRKRVIERRGPNSGIADANAFQDGKKRILVFSDAGGTGRSYHADLTAKNQQQRVHYLLQPGWEASKAVQGFGRTHRSNQASAPIFRLITTNVMGQKRFTSTIARRLDQLGALTKGQRQAGSGVFGEKDNLENPIAQDALSQYYRTVDVDVLKRLGLYEKIYDEFGHFNDKSDAIRDIGKFLNRILSLEVDKQNEVFQGFYDTFDRFMDTAIRNGTVDMGLENYRADKIDVVDEKVVRKDPSGADTKYVQMTAYHKPTVTPLSKVKDLHDNFEGLVRLEDGSVRAVYEISSKTNATTGEIQKRYKLESPQKGKYSTYVEETLKNQTKPIPKDEWGEAWKEETAKLPEYDTNTLHLLTGTLLPIWDRLPQENTRVMRVLSSDGRQYLGRVIRPDQIDGVLRGLGANRTMKQYTGKEVSSAVLNENKEAVFERDRLRLNRRRVSGEWRMELTGSNIWYLGRQYPGIINERINYDYRYFIPTGAAGERILDDLMKNNPVVDLRDAAPEDVDAMANIPSGGDRTEEWSAERISGGEVKEARSLSEIIESIRHDIGVNVTTGHVRGKRGQYNRRTHGIRTKGANDLPAAAHELGHHLDNVYGLRDHLSPEIIAELQNGMSDEMRAHYPRAKWNTEGIAEYFRKYLQNRETAAIDYPTFTAYFKGLITEKDAALIDQIADEVNAYYALDADTATSSIRLREEKRPDARTFNEKIRDDYDAFYQQWFDSNHGIKLFSEAVGDDRSYKLATNAAYRDAVAGAIITGDLRDANGQYVSPGLGAALHGVNLKSKREYREFGEYLVVKHGPERLAEGMRIFADDRKNSTAWMQRRQAELEEKYPAFKEASDRLYQFLFDLYQTWGVDTGLISEATFKEWRKRWSYYVPLNRAVPVQQYGRGARRGFANQNSTVKQAHGSGLDIINPVDNIIDNLVRLVNAGVLNDVMRSITDAAGLLGADASLLERVPTPMRKAFFDASGLKKNLAGIFDDSAMSEADKIFALDTIGNIDDVLEQYKKGKAFGDVVTVMKGGEQEFWKINDPLLLSSLVNMSQGNRSGLLNAYGAITRFMTANITGNNIWWGIFSNFPRDLQTLYTYSDDKNPLRLLGGIGSAYVNKFKGDHAEPLYKEYLAMGGGQTSASTADRDLAKKARMHISGSKLQWLNPMEWLGFVSDLIESGPRYATYKLCRQKGMNPQEAIYAAHDITVNFRRGGTAARETNKVIPFFNAGVQGLDKFARWASAEDVPISERKTTVVKRIGSYAAVMLALGATFYALNNSDEEARKNYQQLSNYTKNNYWLIPLGGGKYFAIPKARELSVLSSFFETAMEYAHGGNQHAFDDFWSYVSGNFLPSVVSDVVAAPETGLEAAGYGAMSSLGIVGVVGSILANRDFLGRPIVSASMQYYEKKDQYNRRTSKLAKAAGEAFNESPQKIDYFFQQSLGGHWKAQKALFPVGGENVDFTLGVQNSYIKDNQYSTDLTNWLYDKASTSAAAKKSDPANMEKAITATMDDHMTTFYSRYYKLTKDNPETVAERGTRQIVLDMILEYRKADDLHFTSETERMIYAVCAREGTTDYLPGVMQSTVKDGSDTKHLLSDVQYVEYQTDYLRRYYEYVETQLPAAKSENEEVAILKAAKSVAKDTATERALSRIGATSSGYSAKYDGIPDSDVILFKAALDMADDDGGLSQAEVIDAINSLGLSRSQSSTLFHTKYDSDKNNPYR